MKVQIGTYNIQHGVDRLHYLKTKEWKVDLPAVVNAIRTMELDICGELDN
jgi:endonuclease/exonuclease/phosphatase family metal-dependent hydrolase